LRHGGGQRKALAARRQGSRVGSFEAKSTKLANKPVIVLGDVSTFGTGREGNKPFSRWALFFYLAT
jgi:hypothetical protein